MRTDSLLHIEAFGELFKRVQMQRIFADQKTFADSIPKYPVADIIASFNAADTLTDDDLTAFVKKNFYLPENKDSGFTSDVTEPVEVHINRLWDVLTKEEPENTGTGIGLPRKFVAPGGRFRELFYWDSYFTMLGLKAAGKTELLEDMVDDFAFLVNKFGFIPNGTRTYFLSRSQPPFFSLMIELLSEVKGDSVYVKYLPQLSPEYDFWMRGKEQLSDITKACNRVMLMPDGSVLNRYWDNLDTPRPEGYFDDTQVKNASAADEKIIYRNIRAACESGWDFSGRWFSDGKNMHSLRTADIVPVDLNCLLLHLEQTIAKAHKLSGNKEGFETYSRKANERKAAIQNYLWNDLKQTFADLIHSKNEHSSCLSPAAAFPLFMRMATPVQAEKTAAMLETAFLLEGGIVTTLHETGQQWDMPNGWAPLQWVAYKGAAYYGFTGLALQIRSKWLHTVETVFRQTGKIMEKYNVQDISRSASGGEYPNQDGFGWTNGVYLAMLYDNISDL